MPSKSKIQDKETIDLLERVKKQYNRYFEINSSLNLTEKATATEEKMAPLVRNFDHPLSISVKTS